MTERPSDKAAWPKSEDELVAYIREMVKWPDGASEPGEGYGRCAYAMSYAAVATFNYIASQLGTTGFQAGCADLDILRQTRGMENGFLICNADDLLYPQYDLLERLREWIEKMLPILAPIAEAKIKEDHGIAHPDVRRHWERIVQRYGEAVVAS